MTHNILISFVWIMVTAVFIYPCVYVSLTFSASYQILTVWGCIAIALYGLMQYAIQDEETTTLEKKRILRNMLKHCAILTIWILFIFLNQVLDPVNMTPEELRSCYRDTIRYKGLHSRIFSKFPPEEAVDITSQFGYLDSKYVKTGAVSVVLKNKKYFLQYNVKALFYCNRGVPSLLGGAYFEMSLEDYKKQLAKNSENYNSLELSSHYDGISNVFYQVIF